MDEPGARASRPHGMFDRTGALVERKFREYLVPAILTNLAISVTNSVDSAIVGNALGETALSAIGLSSPVIYCLNALFMLFAAGGTTCAAIARGRREDDTANGIFTLTFAVGISLMLLLTIGLLAFMQPLTMALARGDAELAALTKAYLTPTVYVGPVMMLVMGMAHFSRVDGRPRIAAYISITANVVNLCLALVFILIFDMGIAGAGLATVIGYSVGIFMVLPFIFSKKRTLKFIKPRKKHIADIPRIMGTGSPKALTHGLSFLRASVLNSIIVGALGSLGMSAMAVCTNAFMLTAMFINGANDTLLPIVGNLFGEKDYPGIKYAVRAGFKFTGIACIAMMALFLIIPEQTGRMFGIDSPEGLEIVIPALRIYALCLPVYGINTLLQAFYQTTGRVRFAALIVTMNGFVFVALFAVILARFTDGFIWPAFVMAEAATLAAALLTGARVRRKEGVSGHLLLKKSGDSDIKLDITIPATVEAAQDLSERITAFCTEHGADKADAMKLGLAAEEMSVNTARYGHPGAAGVIDVLVRITKQDLILRLRDDGAPFDPTQYKSAEQKEFAIGGIEVIRRLASGISYARQLGFNSAVITIPNKP